MLNMALRYQKMGLSVIPLVPKGKSPPIPWTEFQSRRMTTEEIVQHWTRVPNANIGIVTGKISGIAVIDLDGPEGSSSAIRLGLRSTAISITGNGKHLWYRLTDGIVQNAVRRYPGVDIRGEGGYIVAPPSINPNGKRYRWLGNLNLKNLPMFPQRMFVTGSLVDSKIKEESWIANALKEMKDGNIDNTLTSVCGRLRRDGYSATDALVLLQPHAMSAGAEPGHLEAKISNVWGRYSPAVRVENGNRNDVGTGSRRFDGDQPDLVIHSPADNDSWKQFEQRSLANQERGDSLKTGYTKLDSMLAGGLKSSRLFTVAARTGSGKTNWLLAAARQICRSGKVVLLFSTEMPYEDIWQRYINALEDGEEFRQHKFYVCDSFAPNIEKVEEAINAVKPDVFMFDHINHVSEEQRELGSFMQGLNWLKRKYDIAGIVTAQLNRSADWVDLKTGEKVTPRMSMIKGSGTIEQASSRVLLLSETRVLPEYTEIVGNLDKNDNGQKGLIHFGLYQNPWRMSEL